MTTLSNLIRNEINPRCLTKGKLKKEGCEVKMTNAPPRDLSSIWTSRAHQLQQTKYDATT